MNAATLKYCKEFIESKNSPNFAIFLKGRWGVGKTYFIEELIKSYQITGKANHEKIKEKNFLKISLFGITSTDQIGERIFQKAHPILSKVVDPMARIVQSVVSKKIEIDFAQLNNYIKKLPQRNSRVLIIDDIERAEIPISQIFGYFSELIYETNIRVIFVGNEEKIVQHEDTENDTIKRKTDFALIKEKTIGMEFYIEADIDSAIKKFFEEFKFDEESFIQNKIKEVFTNFKCENLRIMWQSLYNLKILISALPKEMIEKEKQIVISYFLILFIQKSMAEIDEQTKISQVLNIYEHYAQSYKTYTDKKHENDGMSMSYDLFYTPKILFRLWKDIVFKGNYDSIVIANEYKREKEEFEASKQSELFCLLIEWRSLNKAQFKNLVNSVQKDFLDGKYLKIAEAFRYAYTFVIFSKYGLIPDRVDDIEAHITELIKKYKQYLIPIKEWDTFLMDYQFSHSIPEFKFIQEKLKTLNDELLNKKEAEELNHLINKLNISSEDFIKAVLHNFYGKAILCKICIPYFYKKLSSLSISEQSAVINVFEQQYGIIYGEKIKKQYEQDYNNLKLLLKLYLQNKKSLLYDPQELLKDDIIKRLEKLVKHFEDAFVK